MIPRRAFLGGAATLLATGAGGSSLLRARRAALRVGVMSNVTHAPLLAGLGSGRIGRALAPLAVETRVFRAGPRVTEALLGDAIDVGTAGPAPIVALHARHAPTGGGLAVLSGCASGGASLVVTRQSGIRGAADLRGKRLAVTQIGTTQDDALRVYLAGHALREGRQGGDVGVVANSAATLLAEMKRGELDGAWLAEPWATRVVRELDAVRLVDERDLWPDRRFATAVLVTRRGRQTEPAIVRLKEALAEEVARALRDPPTTRDEAYAELRRLVGNPGSPEVFTEALRRVDFTTDPERATIEKLATVIASLGLAPPGGALGLFPG